jgi:hypothetical protein
MGRLINGWLNRVAIKPFPLHRTLHGLPDIPEWWKWLRYDGVNLIAFRSPRDDEEATAREWAKKKAKELEIQARQAKAAKRAPAVAPRKAIEEFIKFLDAVPQAFEGLDKCPVCGGVGRIEARPGKAHDGADAVWWATCPECESEWGLRSCTGCGVGYRALAVHTGLDVPSVAAKLPFRDWSDRLFGRDQWAQMCSSKYMDQFRCPSCGVCHDKACSQCQSRKSAKSETGVMDVNA